MTHFSKNCSREVAALADCEKKHPREKEFVCRHLTQMVAECAFSQVCAAELDSLRSCLTVYAKREIKNVLRYDGPIPPQCAFHMENLEMCLGVGQQEDPPPASGEKGPPRSASGADASSAGPGPASARRPAGQGEGAAGT